MKAKRTSTFIFIIACMQIGCGALFSQPSPYHDLRFDSLSRSWDEGIPLGNGMLGALVWQKGDRLRISLDQATLWDLRPLKGLHRPEFRYDWIAQQVGKKEYGIVQEYFDAPYEKEPAPTKIPGAAIELDIAAWGPVEYARLDVAGARGEVKWRNGVLLELFVHATHPQGWFRFTNVSDEFRPELVPPRYEGSITSAGGSVEGDDLARLGYTQGSVVRSGQTLVYKQAGWGGFHYEAALTWRRVNDNAIEGVWSISSHFPRKPSDPATVTIKRAMKGNYNAAFREHTAWWNEFWSHSALHIPDTLLEKQWYLEQYKFGSAARRGAPPISLQAVWTADNGRIPPWKGDFHHDLNTQLSYWPAYSGNHLDAALGYLDHLDENKANYKRYTKRFFGKEGLAVPGVTTLDGTEMGGWTQYSLSPTISAWLGQHYYLQWKYSMDTVLLRERAYPWVSDVARFLEEVTIRDEKGYRRLPIGSSPEINNNDITAWFTENTNYDLALMRFTFQAASEMAFALGDKVEAERWSRILREFPDYALTDEAELMFSPSLPYNESHRHFSHLMAIHPLGLIRWEDGEPSRAIIRNSLRRLKEVGPGWWCGYSWSWLANLSARAKDGDGAAEALKVFAKAFCLKNSFHVNGDQTRSGYSRFTYRPFTLEGNFAFAAGLQEMLIQSYAGFIEIMPAIPAEWQDVSFSGLRTEGAFIVSAIRTNGTVKEVRVRSAQGGTAKLKKPFDRWTVVKGRSGAVKEEGGYLEIHLDSGEEIVLQRPR